MKQTSPPPEPPTRPQNPRPGKKKKIALGITLLVALILGGFTLAQIIRLQFAAAGSVDAILVLGGSIKREIHVTQFAQTNPDIPIFISQGSAPPCVWLIFERDRASKQNVWLEQCAYSTFTNFTFSGELLKQSDVKKVKVITSASHLPRAKWLAQILLGAKGIAVEMETVEEEGIPGNQEFVLKTILDVIRSLIWVLIAQVYSPECDQVQPLNEVDMVQWELQGYECEHQGQLE
jgi:hypothetical protein